MDCTRCAEVKLATALGVMLETFSLERDEHQRPVDPPRKLSVDRARKIIKEHPRELLPEMPRDVMQMLVDTSEHEQEHTYCVNPAIPGIVGRFGDCYILIDGIHRLARCLRDGLPFYCYALTEAETAAIEFEFEDMPDLVAEFCPDAQLFIE